MSLRLILGLETRQKTEYMAAGIPQGEKTRILVPDQYTLAAEKEYLSLLGEERMSSVEILSFKRFASRVFEQTGTLAFELIGEGGRQALLSKAIHETAPLFRYYPRGFYSMQFVRLVMPMIRNLKTAGVTPTELEETAKAEHNDKLSDIALIYGAFESLLSEGFFDPDDDYTRLCRLLGKEKRFAGQTFLVDFFRTFNAGERRVIASLLSQDAEVSVSLPCEKISSQETMTVLSEVELCGWKILSSAEKKGCRCETVLLSKEDEEKPPALRFLSRNLLADRPQVYAEACPELSFYLGDDVFDEIEFVASEISRLVREEDYRYRDFVIAARDIDRYAGVLDPVFDEYNIPVFYHRKTPLRQKSIALLVSTLLEILAEGFTPLNVLTALKTGFFDYPEEDVRLFENYISLWSIKGSGFEKPFVLPVRGLSRYGGEDDDAVLARIEALRLDFVGKILSLRKETEGKTVEETARSLFSFLTALEIEEHLRVSAEQYLKFNEQALYAEQLQVYDLIVETFDEIVLTCGRDRLSLKEFYDLTVSVLDSKDIAILPTSADEVMTGNLNRLPFTGQKIVFTVGLGEGVFPENPTGDALLSEKDKQDLSKNDVSVGMNNRQKVMYERLLAFFTFTAPRQKLYLSCPDKDRRSPFLLELQKAFPLAETRFSPLKSGGASLEDRIVSERSAFSVYAKTKAAFLKEFFAHAPRYRHFFEKEKRRDLLSPSVSKGLFGTDLTISPSRAECFFKCPFSYFLSDGLRLRGPETAKINGIQVGNFVHEAMEKLLPQVLQGKDPAGLTKGFADEYLSSLLGGAEPSASMREYFSVLEYKAERILKRLASEMPRDSFYPVAFEAKVGRGMFPSQPREVLGGTVSLRGKVDRIDLFSADRDYVRIVDYKTYDRTIDLRKVADGTEMQMPLYLSAVVGSAARKGIFGEKTVAPAGVMYLLANPKIKMVPRGTSFEEIERIVWEKTASGLVLDLPQVSAAMGETAKKLKALSETEFSEMFETVEKNVTYLAESVLSGRLPIDPLLLTPTSRPGRPSCPESCVYCPYRPYCRKEKPEE